MDQGDAEMEQVDIQVLNNPGDTMEEEGGAIKPAVVQDEFAGEYTWRISNFTALTDQKLYSPKFEIGTYIWRLLIFPKGNPNNRGENNLAVYLDAPEATYTPVSMSPKAKFELILVNTDPHAQPCVKETSHTFTPDQNDWGFTGFIGLDVVLNPANGYLHDGRDIILTVRISIQRDDRYSWDSRKETGFVGLKNQGATCYMNSLLQTLFHLPAFRKAVYHMPTLETDDVSSNMPLALQSVFYKLQYSKTSVATKALTKSFGWGTYDAFMQHDVQELNRVLCEKLENKMKGTKVERIINQLFEGHTVNFIRCLHVPCTSERKESFMDLQLDVKGCPNIYESFNKYTETEMLDGANQYMAEGYGLQDAKKGVTFLDLPPVLQLQLKRFAYDFERDANIKINDRYEFYEELDLDREDRRYFSDKSDRSVRNLYKLHSVLVHSGGTHGGHYYAFIRPDGKTWYKFDDEKVELADSKRAVEDQYGGEDDGLPTANSGGFGPNGGGMRYTRFSNAYMLVYVREDDWDEIMCSVGKEELQEHLRKRLEAEQAEKEQRQKDKAEAHQYVSIKVATDLDMAEAVNSGHKVFDLVDSDRLAPDRGSFRVRKSMYFSEFKQMVSKALGVPVECQRYWSWVRRPNGSVRVARVLTSEEEAAQIMDLREHRDQTRGNINKAAIMDIPLYLETPEGMKLGPFTKPLFPRKTQGMAGVFSDIFLFVKMYDPVQEKLTYMGRFYCPKGAKPQEIALYLCRITGLPDNTKLELYEEVKSEPTVMVERIDEKKTMAMAKLEDGDIIVVQRVLSEAERGRVRFPSAPQFFEYVLQRRLVRFVPLENPQAEGITVELRQDSNYDEVTQELAVKLMQLAQEQGSQQQQQQQQPMQQGSQQGQSQPQQPQQPAMPAAFLAAPEAERGAFLRLTQFSHYSQSPMRQPVRFRAFPKLAQVLTSGIHALPPPGPNQASPTDILYYEVLDMPLEQLEQLKTLKVTFHKESGDPVSEHVVRLKREANVSDLIAEVATQVGQAAQGRALRLLAVHTCKIWKVHAESESVESLDDQYWRLRVEPVGQGEEGLDAGAAGPSGAGSPNSSPAGPSQERLLHCYHYRRERQQHGPPASSLQGSQQQLAPGSPNNDGNAPMDVQGDSVQVQGPVIHFGDPLLVRCGPEDTLGTLKQRIQAKLGVSDEELSKWKWAFFTHRTGLEYLSEGDQEPVGPRLGRALAAGGAEQPYLGMEHEDDKPRRAAHTTTRAATYERTIRIMS